MDTLTKTRLDPTLIGPDTFLIHDHHGEGTSPVVVGLNAMVIRAQEPVVVDTGMHENETQFLADVFDLVEPDDVRWVFISHDDIDHTGNLNALMAACPNATAVVNWFITERMGASLQVPPSRWRWIADGDTFDVGDHRLRAVRPPVYDSPTTRGLFDTSTGVYWASDAFASPMLAPARTVDELDADFWVDGMMTFNNYVSPWLSVVDGWRYRAPSIASRHSLRSTIAGCHTPAIPPALVAVALEAARRSPGAAVAPQPDQSMLDELPSFGPHAPNGTAP